MTDIVERLENSLKVNPTHLLRNSDIAEAGSAIKHQRAEIEDLRAALMWVFDRLSVAVGRGAEGMTVKEQRDTHREVGYALLGRASRATKHKPNDWDPSAELVRGDEQKVQKSKS